MVWDKWQWQRLFHSPPSFQLTRGEAEFLPQRLGFGRQSVVIFAKAKDRLELCSFLLPCRPTWNQEAII